MNIPQNTRCTQPFVSIFRHTYDIFCAGKMRLMYETGAQVWNRVIDSIESSQGGFSPFLSIEGWITQIKGGDISVADYVFC